MNMAYTTFDIIKSRTGSFIVQKVRHSSVGTAAFGNMRVISKKYFKTESKALKYRKGIGD